MCRQTQQHWEERIKMGVSDFQVKGYMGFWTDGHQSWEKLVLGKDPGPLEQVSLPEMSLYWWDWHSLELGPCFKSHLRKFITAATIY